MLNGCSKKCDILRKCRERLIECVRVCVRVHSCEKKGERMCLCVRVRVRVWAWVSVCVCVCRWAFIAWAWERARTFVTSKSDSWNKNQPGKKYLRLLELNLKYWQSFGNFPRFYHNWIGCNLSLMPFNFFNF